MNFRCDALRLHDWGKWRTTTQETHHMVVDAYERRQPSRDYFTEITVQARVCKRCGLLRVRK